MVHPEPRDLIMDPLPDTYLVFPDVIMLKIEKEKFYGTPSPITKLVGNLYAHIRPLRQ